MPPELRRTLLGIAAAAVGLIRARSAIGAPILHRTRTLIADTVDCVSDALGEAADAVRPVWTCPTCEAEWYRENGAADGTACPDCSPAWCDECDELKPWCVQQDGRAWCEPCARELGMVDDEDLVDSAGGRCA